MNVADLQAKLDEATTIIESQRLLLESRERVSEHFEREAIGWQRRYNRLLVDYTELQALVPA